jgi:hypothetical protein
VLFRQKRGSLLLHIHPEFRAAQLRIFGGFHPLYPAEVSPSDAGPRIFAARKPVLVAGAISTRSLDSEHKYRVMNRFRGPGCSAGLPWRQSTKGALEPQVNPQLRRYRVRTQATG